MKELLALILAATQIAGGMAFISEGDVIRHDETEISMTGTDDVTDGTLPSDASDDSQDDGETSGDSGGTDGTEDTTAQTTVPEIVPGDGDPSSDDPQLQETSESGTGEAAVTPGTLDDNGDFMGNPGDEDDITEVPTPGTEADPSMTPGGDPLVTPDITPEATPSAPVTSEASAEMVDAFVTRLYSVTLNRAPDEAGLRSWADLLISRKATGASVARGFIYSAEFQGLDLSNEDYVECMYLAFMGRQSDPAGKAGWVNVLESMGREAGRENVFAGFANSAEFLAICQSYGIVRGYYVTEYDCDETGEVNLFVERLYSVILGRNSDPEGLRGWTQALMSHSNTGIEAASGFIFSREYVRMGRSDSEFIDDLYMAFMGRRADAAGKQAWLARLNAGDSRRMVFNGFATSPEFTAICDSYGILRGDALPITSVETGGHYSWTYAMARNGRSVPSGWIDSFIQQSRYWLAHNPQVVYRMGGKSCESGYVDCSGFVTQLFRRAVGTMAMSGSFASDPNDAANFAGYQDMTFRGTWNDNRGGARPTAEGTYNISSSRYYTCYVDQYGIASPNLMDVVHWYDYLMSNDVQYTCVNVREASLYHEWDFLSNYHAGDIVIWSGRNGNFSSADDVHIAVYDGDGGVYQSSGNTGGISHTPIDEVLMNPANCGAKKIYIFRMS